MSRYIVRSPFGQLGTVAPQEAPSTLRGWSPPLKKVHSHFVPNVGRLSCSTVAPDEVLSPLRPAGRLSAPPAQTQMFIEPVTIPTEPVAILAQPLLVSKPPATLQVQPIKEAVPVLVAEPELPTECTQLVPPAPEPLPEPLPEPAPAPAGAEEASAPSACEALTPPAADAQQLLLPLEAKQLDLREAPEARTPEGVKTRHPPQRPVKARLSSAGVVPGPLGSMRLSEEHAPAPQIEAEEEDPQPSAAEPTPSKPIPQEPCGSRFLDEAHAARICAAQTLEELEGLKVPSVSCPTCSKHCPDQMRCRQRAEQAAFRQQSEGPAPYILQGWRDGARRPHVGTWMVEMVHRVHLDDPKLQHLDFGCLQIPTGEQEVRILPKLFEALGRNTHLKELLLGNTGLQSNQESIAELAKALRLNKSLRKLDLQANYLELTDLKAIFESLAANAALEELKVNFQASIQGDFAQQMRGQAGTEVYKAAAEVLRTNRSLVKLDLLLLQRHWQDQICRGLMQNREEEQRRKGREALPRKVSYLPEP